MLHVKTPNRATYATNMQNSETSHFVKSCNELKRVNKPYNINQSQKKIANNPEQFVNQKVCTKSDRDC